MKKIIFMLLFPYFSAIWIFIIDITFNISLKFAPFHLIAVLAGISAVIIRIRISKTFSFGLTNILSVTGFVLTRDIYPEGVLDEAFAIVAIIALPFLFIDSARLVLNLPQIVEQRLGKKVGKAFEKWMKAVENYIITTNNYLDKSENLGNLLDPVQDKQEIQELSKEIKKALTETINHKRTLEKHRKKLEKEEDITAIKEKILEIDKLLERARTIKSRLENKVSNLT